MPGKDKKQNATNFRVNRSKEFDNLYNDEVSRKNRQGETLVYSTVDVKNAAAVRKLLNDAITNKQTLVETSKQLYITNPIYASVINYLAEMFTWQYKVTPHRVYTKSKAKARKQIADADFQIVYSQMLELVDGLSIETKFTELLTRLFITGSTYFTSYLDEDSMTINMLLLPEKYCRTIGQTQYGTYIIEFDFSYFTDLGYSELTLKDFLKS